MEGRSQLYLAWLILGVSDTSCFLVPAYLTSFGCVAMGELILLFLKLNSFTKVESKGRNLSKGLRHILHSRAILVALRILLILLIKRPRHLRTSLVQYLFGTSDACLCHRGSIHLHSYFIQCLEGATRTFACLNLIHSFLLPTYTIVINVH